MDPSSTLCLLSCLVLLGLSAFFSASESAFVGANRIKLKTLAENGLTVLETVCPISARLVANPASYRFQTEEILTLVSRLQDQIVP